MAQREGALWSHQDRDNMHKLWLASLEIISHAVRVRHENEGKGRLSPLPSSPRGPAGAIKAAGVERNYLHLSRHWDRIHSRTVRVITLPTPSPPPPRSSRVPFSACYPAASTADEALTRTCHLPHSSPSPSSSQRHPHTLPPFP